MDHNDRTAIDDLFDKLRRVEMQAPAPDPDARRYIGDRIAGQPAAPYLMAQTIVVQDQALAAANDRIAELEDQLENRAGARGGLLGSLFGGGRTAPSRYGRSDPRGTPMGGGWNGGASRGGMGGGGFLAGAAQTAMGVAGGVVLGNMLAGMFTGDEAQAAEADTDAGDAGDFGDGEF